MAEQLNNTIIKAGRLVRVENLEKHPAANAGYYAIWVEDADGSNERCLLFTETELKRATDRATKNAEDLTRKLWWRDIID